MKKAIDKARSGQAIVNTNDVDSLVSRDVNFLPKAPLAEEDRNGATALSQNFFRAPTRLSRIFDRQQKRDHSDGFGLWVLAIMATKNAYQGPTLTPPALDYC